jgi:hypothetical protein
MSACLRLQVCDELMNIELRQVEKFEALVDEFENRLNELKTEALESQQLFFRCIEDLEEKFSSGRFVCAVRFGDAVLYCVCRRCGVWHSLAFGFHSLNADDRTLLIFCCYLPTLSITPLCPDRTFPLQACARWRRT